jgi:hypothetical protein
MTRRFMLIATVAVIACCALLSTASAHAHCSPKGEFVFAQCPVGHGDQATLIEAPPFYQAVTVLIGGFLALGTSGTWLKHRKLLKRQLIVENGEPSLEKPFHEITGSYLKAIFENRFKTILGSRFWTQMLDKRLPIGEPKSHGYSTVPLCRAGGQC